MPPRSRSKEDKPEQPTTEDTSPSLSPDPTPTSPLFSAPRSPEPLTPETDPAWSPSPDESGASEAAGYLGTASEAPSTRSVKAAARERLRALKKTAEAAVATAGGFAHRFLTRPSTLERESGLWLPDEDDVEAISDPLASLASRRTPKGAENPDVTDLIRLALGVVSYVAKQLDQLEQLRAYQPNEPQGAPPAGEGVGTWVEVEEPSYP